MPVQNACESLQHFNSVKRRLEKIYDHGGVRVFDDFAHHPTAISETIAGLRNQVGDQRIIAVLEPRSNTMKQGVHKDQLADALQSANKVMIFAGDQVLWNINELADERISTFDDTARLLDALEGEIEADVSSGAPVNVLIMSNGGFENIHQRLIESLDQP